MQTFSCTKFIPMSGLQNLTLKNEFLKSPYSSLSENFRSILVLILKCQIYENICDDHHSSVLCSLDMQFNKHAVVLLHGWDHWGMPFIHFFPRKNAFPTIAMLPFSFNTNYDVITVFKQSANRAIILAQILSYAVTLLVQGFALIRSVPLFFFNHCTPLLVR